MKIGLLMACACIALGGMPSNAEEQRVIVPNTQQFTIVSTETQRPYRIFVDVPTEQPSSSAGYPVIYFLDGNASFLIAAGIWRLQATRENDLEPALVVAVGYEGDQNFMPEARYRDLTPHPDEDGVPEQIIADGLTKFGEADAFFRFIQADLKPLVQQRFKVDSTRQALFGHSLGGLFVLHTMLTHPDSFSSYISGSPAIWWNKKSILRNARNFTDKAGSEAPHARILIGVGAKEPETMVANSQAIADILRNSPHLEVCFLDLPNEDHLSAMSALISRAVLFTLASGSCPYK